MNLNFIGLGAAIAMTATTATMLGSAPAQALSLTGGPLTGVLSINRDASVASGTGLVQSVDANFVDFGADNNVGSGFTIGTTNLLQSDFNRSTGSFAGILSGTIKDLPIFASFPAGGITGFITATDSSGTISFDLVSLVAPNLISNPAGPRGGFQADLRGFFRPSNVPNLPGDLLQARLTTVNNVLTIELTPVPTPALVPAALGFGAAMLRKRKGDKAEKEAAGAKA